nr:Chain 1, Geopilin domain 2 protein [Geobacter sulfurreducens]6VK9_3 Chain 3, Geopilin domain 2 protein [Geobacter sulfurreducens]6VK9_5 Chain 5, Geopilin domain 2 protein [Geobacter sulfurreducens]6VK9_B Chain B, Geopilin domain 2 protein [Geobacter sulfurreducens]6VK9_D Chain D, Geopilin domain 2 protein [Geobacter sulfurreducens]6VK9_F Chain F, Geopilin domain 2 protein [Geobacter sulfurreducens]6VK9_H Chain H, Geopilin domain 2 protein [Geobacter sulfurreducens]6VK9_J Chain J, Geopilin
AGKIPTTTMGGKDFTFKPSTNVSVSYFTTNGATSTAGTVNTDYAVNTKNSSGNRVFTSTNNTSNIWYIENDAWKGKAVSDSDVTALGTGDVGKSDFSGTEWKSQ